MHSLLFSHGTFSYEGTIFGKCKGHTSYTLHKRNHQGRRNKKKQLIRGMFNNVEKFSKTTQAKEKDRTSVKFRVKTTHSSQDYSQPS